MKGVMRWELRKPKLQTDMPLSVVLSVGWGVAGLTLRGHLEMWVFVG